eukprot:gene15467-biopygen12870
MTGMVKNTLRKTLGLANLTVIELQEVLLYIEFCLNNRPRTYETDQLEDERKWWIRSSREYLTSLREHNKINQGGYNKVAVGDNVLVKDENLPRNKWKLGKVIDIIRGKDGMERGVTLKTTTRGKTYEIDRPVQNLYPLKLQADSDDKKAQGKNKAE